MSVINDEYSPESKIAQTLSQLPDGIDLHFLALTKTKSATGEPVIPSNETLLKVSSELMELVKQGLITIKDEQVFSPLNEMYNILNKSIKPNLLDVEKAVLFAVKHYGETHEKKFTEGYTKNNIMMLFHLVGYDNFSDIELGLNLALNDGLIEPVKNPNGTLGYVLTKYGREKLKTIIPLQTKIQGLYHRKK